MTNNPSDALRCPDYDEAARHAYSDATTLGFFNPKCPKHQADVLRAAIRKACEEAAKNLPEPRGISDADVADIIERHLTPVFEALRDSVIEECAKVAGQCWNNWNSEQFCHAAHIERQIRALKGAPR